jgi:LysR family transcriptional activator of nhaA
MKHLNYKHLHYFWTVAREGGVVRASELLNLTPQTISGQLRLLEEAVGTPLFSRSGRNLVLTETGQLVQSYAEEIFALGAELGEVLRGRPAGRPVQFTVGIVDVVPKLIAYELLAPAYQLPEPVRIVCQEGKLEQLLADLAVHKLDLVLADSPLGPTMNVRAFNHLLGESGMTFFAARELASRYGPGFPRSLDNAPILLPSRASAVRGALTQWMDELGIQPVVVGEFDDNALLKAFGQAGVGVFCVPQAIEHEVERQYHVVPIGRTDAVRERFYAISPERRLKHPAVVAVSTAARERVFHDMG